MELHEPVVASGRVMLQHGRPITAAEIEALRRVYPTLTVRIVDEVLDAAADFEDDSEERKIAMETQLRISESLAEVHDRITRKVSLRGADLVALQNAVTELIEHLKGNPPAAALVSRCLDPKSYLSEHAGNVFYLSLLLGAKAINFVSAERKRQTRARDLRPQHAEDLFTLGLGAAVMDLGMIPLQELFESDDTLSAKDLKALRQHPIAGVALLPEDFSPLSRMVVRTHHENYDGSGYPKSVPGDKVHVFSRIVRIADAYSAAISGSPYHGAKSSAQVLWEMTVGPYRRFYDPKLMAVFVSLIQPFPIGAKLRLSDGRYAAVVEYNRRSPFRPKVLVAFDADDQRIPKQQLRGPVDLATRPELRIDSFLGEELSFMYAAEPAQDAPVSTEFSTPYEAAFP